MAHILEHLLQDATPQDIGFEDFCMHFLPHFFSCPLAPYQKGINMLIDQKKHQSANQTEAVRADLLF